MPRIPTMRRPELRMTQLNGAQAPGVPNDFGRIDLGGLAAGIDSGLSSISGFLEQKRRADDADAASQIELESAKIYGEADSRMRENPNEYAKFDQWRQESAQRLGEVTRPYLDQLSPEARKQAEYRMAMTGQAFAKRVRDTATQADITVKRGNFDNRIKYYAEVGDYESARQQVRLAADSGLYRPDEIELYDKGIAGSDAFAAVRSRIDAGTPGVFEELEAKDKAGKYTAYPELPLDRRGALISAARRQQNISEAAGDDELVNRLLNGEDVPETEMEADFSAGRITLDTSNRRRKLVRDYLADRDRKQREQDHQQNRLEKMQREDAADRMEVEIMDFKFANDAGKRAEEYNRFNQKIHDTFFARNPALAMRVKRQLESSYKAADKPDDASYKKSPQYAFAMQKADSVKDRLFSQKYEDRSFWRIDDDKSKETKLENHALLKLKLDEFVRLNPKATQPEIDKYVEDMVTTFNTTAVSRRLEAVAGIAAASAAGPVGSGKIAVRRGTYNGKPTVEYLDGSIVYADGSGVLRNPNVRPATAPEVKANEKAEPAVAAGGF